MFSNLWIESLAPQIATASLQPSDANTTILNFTAMAGQTISGTQHLARLHFTTVPGQASSFVPLDLGSMNGARAAAGNAPTLLANDGRVVVVGAKPLVEARAKGANQREVTLYGKRSTTYVIEYATNLVNGGTWRTRGTVFAASMTNMTQTLLLNTPAPPVFFRARQQ